MSDEEIGEQAPVRASVTVHLAPEAAFRLFTEGFGTWWPVETHAIEEGPDTRAVLEPRADGRIFERHSNGTEEDWGRIVAWDPPALVAFTWKPNREDRPPTEVEVLFSPDPDGTRVELVHRGWERLGELGAPARRDYETGWPGVLARFASAA